MNFASQICMCHVPQWSLFSIKANERGTPAYQQHPPLCPQYLLSHHWSPLAAVPVLLLGKAATAAVHSAAVTPWLEEVLASKSWGWAPPAFSCQPTSCGIQPYEGCGMWLAKPVRFTITAISREVDFFAFLQELVR